MANTESKKIPMSEQNKVEKTTRPNESGTISVESHIKIFDPKNQYVFVEGRA